MLASNNMHSNEITMETKGMAAPEQDNDKQIKTKADRSMQRAAQNNSERVFVSHVLWIATPEQQCTQRQQHIENGNTWASRDSN